MIYTNRNIFIDKVINSILSKKNSFYKHISPIRTAGKLLGQSNEIDVDALKSIFGRVLGNIWNVDLSKISEADRKAILKEADFALNHKFDILGSGRTLVDPIDWHTDFKSGRTWAPGTFYRDYDVNSKGGSDIKMIWDFSRAQHLLWLSEAYTLTKENKYSREIIDEINQWIDENPLMFSINWTCSMDVAIRAIHWMYSVATIIESGDVTDDFVRKFYKSLYEHGFYIINNLERTIPYSGNHYLSDLVGLLFIFSAFPNNKFARKCFKFAASEYEREALTEISKDGTNYEHSVSYHRLVSELFLYSYALLERIGYPLNQNIEKRFISAIDYVAVYSSDNCPAPLIGDNDNGRLLPFTPRDFRSHSYLLSVGSSVLGRQYGRIQQTPESLFVVKGLSQKKETIFSSEKLNVYPDNNMVIADCGPARLVVTSSGLSFTDSTIPLKKKTKGSHTHPDALSFVLYIDGHEILTDSGTGVYTPDAEIRNKLRETTAHNTITIDDKNQCSFHSNAFVLTDNLSNRKLLAANKANGFKIIGSYGFNNDSLEYTHQRTFNLSEGSLIIEDEITSSGLHEITENFIVPPGIDISVENDIATLSASTIKAELTTDSGRIKILPSTFSPSYGIITENKRLQSKSELKENIKIKTTIIWKKK